MDSGLLHELSLDQITVLAVWNRHEKVVGSLFDNLPFMQNTDSVGIAYSGQTMGNQKNSTISHGNVDGSLHFMLTRCIQGTRGLIQ
jgi:hypothetical protein